MVENTINETIKRITFEEYLLYVPEDDFQYELDEGRLIKIEKSIGLKKNIADFLVYEIERYLITKNLPFLVKTSLGVRTDKASFRIPDLLVCANNLWQEMVKKNSTNLFNTGEVPELVIEVVGEDRRTDYIKKPTEYALSHIYEYWIIDMAKERVKFLTNGVQEEGYNEKFLLKGEDLVSERFPGLIISVDQIFSPPSLQDLRQEKEMQLLKELDEANQRVAKLAAKLREMGVNIEEI